MSLEVIAELILIWCATSLVLGLIIGRMLRNRGDDDD